MENIQKTIQEQQTVRNFTSMPKEVLETLINELDLHMTVRDLQYCQNQYRMRERRNPTVEELHLLDTLYVCRTRQCEYHGLRSFYTSDPMVAETYADLIAKSTHIRRENRPYTPKELIDVLTHALRQAGKTISVPTLCMGEDAPLRLLANDCSYGECATVNGISAVIGRKNAAKRTAPTMPQTTDQLLLLSPAGMTPSAFASLVMSLPLPPTAKIHHIGQNGLLEALLAWDGIYLVQNYLPGFDDNTPLTELVTGFSDSLLIRVDGEHALLLRNAAAASGLTASVIGKYHLGGRLIVRRDGHTPLQIETAFLRNFSPTIPVDAELPGFCMQETQIPRAVSPQTVSPYGDCALFAQAIPNTPCAVPHAHLITGAVSHPTDNTFRTALLTTLYAINRAVAAGADHEKLTISHQIQTPHTSARNLDMGQTMAALLGTYRAQAELALPNSGSDFSSSPDAHAHLTVVTATPKPQTTIPQQFVGAGNHVYLLAPLTSQSTLVDFEDYRKLLRYVHKLCIEGVALSVAAVAENATINTLHLMMQNGYGFTAISQPPQALCGFLVETNQPIQGILVGITSAFSNLRIGQTDTPIISYRAPSIPTDRIPMSDIGAAHPIICLPQTPAGGNCEPARQFAQNNGAVFKTVLLTDTASRLQLTDFANTLMQANITVIVGTDSELETILSNRRVAFAKQEMLSRGGLLICLHTDRAAAQNVRIPADHPLFFGVPAALLKDSAISFDPENTHIVHMCADSMAIPRMLSCGIAYFK